MQTPHARVAAIILEIAMILLLPGLFFSPLKGKTSDPEKPVS
jgi:hypothetical protein